MDTDFAGLKIAVTAHPTRNLRRPGSSTPREHDPPFGARPVVKRRALPHGGAAPMVEY
jgi:hypothetical protein